MSNVDHFTGKLTPTGKTLKEFDKKADDKYDLDDDVAVEIDGMIYTVEKKAHYPDEEIYKATKNEDGTIDFEVKYYNGSLGFNEAIDGALEDE